MKLIERELVLKFELSHSEFSILDKILVSTALKSSDRTEVAELMELRANALGMITDSITGTTSFTLKASELNVRKICDLINSSVLVVDLTIQEVQFAMSMRKYMTELFEPAVVTTETSPQIERAVERANELEAERAAVNTYPGPATERPMLNFMAPLIRSSVETITQDKSINFEPEKCKECAARNSCGTRLRKIEDAINENKINAVIPAQVVSTQPLSTSLLNEMSRAIEDVIYDELESEPIPVPEPEDPTVVLNRVIRTTISRNNFCGYPLSYRLRNWCDRNLPTNHGMFESNDSNIEIRENRSMELKHGSATLNLNKYNTAAFLRFIETRGEGSYGPGMFADALDLENIELNLYLNTYNRPTREHSQKYRLNVTTGIYEVERDGVIMRFTENEALLISRIIHQAYSIGLENPF